VVLSAVAVTVKSADSPSFSRAIAGWNSKLTPSQPLSLGRIAAGADRIALMSVSTLHAEAVCALMVVGALVVATTPEVVVELGDAVELDDARTLDDVTALDAVSDDVGAVVTPTKAGVADDAGASPVGASDAACGSTGETLMVCPFVAAANDAKAPASPRESATRLTPWASRAASTSLVSGPG
jgi:hypothetical protein